MKIQIAVTQLEVTPAAVCLASQETGHFVEVICIVDVCGKIW